MAYCPLHLHTTYSVGDAYGTIENYKDRLLKLNLHSASITDHGTLGGVVEWVRVLKDNSIKPIIGEELYVVENPEKTKTKYHITILVKNKKGWDNLLKIHFLSHSKFFYYKPRIPYDILIQHLDGLIVLSGCPQNPFIEHDRWLDEIHDKIGDDLYVEVIPSVNYKKTFEVMIEKALSKNIHIVITNDIHYPEKSDYEFRNTVAKILRHSDVGLSENIYYLMSYEEINEHIKQLGWETEWLNETNKISNKIDFVLEPYSNFPLFDFELDIPLDDERIKFEVDRLKRKKYYNYILLIREILNIADDNGVFYGPGRGSIGGSYFAYKLGIHKADPDKYGLLFDRFLSEVRADVPDIDLDFEHVKQEFMIQKIKEKFENVARVGTWTTWHENCARNDLKRINSDVSIEKLINQIRHRGIHAAGIVICKEELSKYIPLERVSEQLVTAWDKHSLDYMRIPKVDILGLKTLSIIRSILQKTGATLPNEFDDPNIYKNIFKASKTLGVFQFQTEFATSLCQYIDCFNDLILVNALLRPGAYQFADEWVAIKTKKKKPNYYDSDSYKAITEETYGLILYQEQIMKIVHEVFGMSWEEAENFRRLTAKGDKRLLKSYKPPSDKREIYELLLNFSKYSFNKSHAVFYAIVAYWTAWLKYYYPIEFYSETLRYETDSSKVKKFVNEIRENGYKIVKPDINRSDVYFTFEDKEFVIGLSYIRNIGENFAQKIVKNRPYRSLREFMAKVEPNLLQFKALVASGALDTFKIPRLYLYNNAKALVEGSWYLVVPSLFFTIPSTEWNEEQKKIMENKYLNL